MSRDKLGIISALCLQSRISLLVVAVRHGWDRLAEYNTDFRKHINDSTTCRRHNLEIRLPSGFGRVGHFRLLLLLPDPSRQGMQTLIFGTMSKPLVSMPIGQGRVKLCI